MKRSLRAIVAMSMMTSMTAPSLHAVYDPESMFLGEIPVVVTASKKAEKATEAPATVHVVSKAEIRARGYSNLKDVLRDLPGMETIENSFSEWGTEVPVRGVVGNNKIAVLLNGVRVNPPGGENFPFRADFSVRNAERIEVVYGPGSTLYGQDAISMLINVITATPKEGTNAEVGLAGGSDSFMQGWTTVSRKSGDIEIVAHAQGQKADLSDTSDTYSSHWKTGTLPAGAPSSPERWDNGGNIFFSLKGLNNSLQFWHRKSSRSSSEGGYNAILHFTKEAVWSDNSTVISLENRNEFSPNLDLTSAISFNKYEIDPKTRYVFGNPIFYNDYKYGVGTGLTLEEKLSWQLESVSLIGGLEASYYDIIPKATVPGGADRNLAFTDQAGTFDYYTSTSPLSALTSIPRANNLIYQNFGAYLEGTWKASDQLKLIAGGRVDKNSRFSPTPFSPRASVVYNPTKSLTTKYIFSKAFVYPAPYFGYNSFFNGAVLNVTNDKLEPEKATSHEVNVSYDTEKMSGSASFFLNQQKNLLIVGDRALGVNIIQNPVFLDAAGATAVPLTHSANSGESTATGVDLTMKTKWGKSSIWASWSYVDFETELLGVTTSLDQTSRDNVRAGATVALLDNLLVTPSVVYRSTPVNLTVAKELRGYNTDPYELNLHVVYTPMERLDLFLDARNLTNDKHALRGVITPTLGEPFRVFAGVKVSL